MLGLCTALLDIIPILPSAHGQSAATDAATLAKYDKNGNGRLDAGELAAFQADQAKGAKTPVESAASKNDGAPVLSPFEVNSSQDRGYMAASSLSGTRLNSKLEDLAASTTVVPKQQLLDTAAVDINDVFTYESKTESMRQYMEYSLEGGYNESTTLIPKSSNRVCGLGVANMAISNFTASRTIPIDTYNVDAAEISRGPNANIFGLGGRFRDRESHPRAGQSDSRDHTACAGRRQLTAAREGLVFLRRNQPRLSGGPLSDGYIGGLVRRSRLGAPLLCVSTPKQS